MTELTRSPFVRTKQDVIRDISFAIVGLISMGIWAALFFAVSLWWV